MLLNAPLPRANQSLIHEGSGLRSVRDADRVSNWWKKNNGTANNLDGIYRSLFKLQIDLGRLRRRIVGGGGTSSTSGVDFKGEYDPTASYKAKVIVIFTPDGGSPGTYISNQPVSGISPDIGLPNWTAFPNSPPGMWG